MVDNVIDAETLPAVNFKLYRAPDSNTLCRNNKFIELVWPGTNETCAVCPIAMEAKETLLSVMDHCATTVPVARNGYVTEADSSTFDRVLTLVKAAAEVKIRTMGTAEATAITRVEAVTGARVVDNCDRTNTVTVLSTSTDDPFKDVTTNCRLLLRNRRRMGHEVDGLLVNVQVQLYDNVLLMDVGRSGSYDGVASITNDAATGSDVDVCPGKSRATKLDTRHCIWILGLVVVNPVSLSVARARKV